MANMAKKLKICFVTEDFYPNFIGGQGIYGLELLTELSKMDVQITVLAENKKGRKEFWRDNQKIKVHLLPYVLGNQFLLALFQYVFFLLRYNKKYFDIVHANQLSGFFFSLFKPKNVKTVIITIHNTNHDLAEASKSPVKRFLYRPLIWLEKLTFEHTDGLIFNTNSEKEKTAAYCDLRTRRCTVAPLGSPDISFSPAQRSNARKNIRRKLCLSSKAKIILYIGRMVEKKGVNAIFEAVKIAHRKDRNIVGIFIGRGNLVRLLYENAPSFIKVLGYVTDTRPHLLAADVFVTMGAAEGGVALSVLEAAAFGLPLVISPEDAAVNILDQGKNGYTAQPDNPRDIAAKILLTSKRSREMGLISRTLSLQFTWPSTAKKTIGFYRSLPERKTDNS